MAHTRQVSRVSMPPVSRHGLSTSRTRSNSNANRPGRAQSMKSSVELRRYRVSSRSTRSGPSCARTASSAASGDAVYWQVARLAAHEVPVEGRSMKSLLLLCLSSPPCC